MKCIMLTQTLSPRFRTRIEGGCDLYCGLAIERARDLLVKSFEPDRALRTALIPTPTGVYS